jgi:hypothetical protein
MLLPSVIETAWDDRAVEAAVDEAITSHRTKIPLSRMRLGPYNGYSGELRNIADRKIKIAIELGLTRQRARPDIQRASEHRGHHTLLSEGTRDGGRGAGCTNATGRLIRFGGPCCRLDRDAVDADQTLGSP